MLTQQGCVRRALLAQGRVRTEQPNEGKKEREVEDAAVYAPLPVWRD